MSPESDASRLARLEERSESILRELSRLAKELERFGPLAGQIIQALADLHNLQRDFEHFRKDVAQRQGLSTTVKVALIAGSFGLVGALAMAVAQIVSGL